MTLLISKSKYTWTAHNPSHAWGMFTNNCGVAYSSNGKTNSRGVLILDGKHKEEVDTITHTIKHITHNDQTITIALAKKYDGLAKTTL